MWLPCVLSPSWFSLCIYGTGICVVVKTLILKLFTEKSLIFCVSVIPHRLLSLCHLSCRLRRPGFPLTEIMNMNLLHWIQLSWSTTLWLQLFTKHCCQLIQLLLISFVSKMLFCGTNMSGREVSLFFTWSFRCKN